MLISTISLSTVSSIRFPRLASYPFQSHAALHYFSLFLQGLLKDCLCQVLCASKDLIAFQGVHISALQQGLKASNAATAWYFGQSDMFYHPMSILVTSKEKENQGTSLSL